MPLRDFFCGTDDIDGESMIFDDEFIKAAEDNPIQGIVDVANEAIEYIERTPPDDGWEKHHLQILIEASALIEALIEAKGLLSHFQIKEQSGDIQANSASLFEFIHNVKYEFEGHATQIKIDSFKSKYKVALNATFCFEFSQGDLDRIQSLVDELRKEISANQILEEEHKQRLLKRLERLQSELHKKVSDLDRFWGMIGDAGVVLRKLGEDAKPIVDRVKEITEIVWRTQARTEELPSDSQNPLITDES